MSMDSMGGGLKMFNSETKHVWSATTKRTPVQNAYYHWQKHGSEFSELQNSKQYKILGETMKIDDELYPCPCCGFKNFSEIGGYEICENCGWEDDPYQTDRPHSAGGANKICLNEARILWAEKLLKDRTKEERLDEPA